MRDLDGAHVKRRYLIGLRLALLSDSGEAGISGVASTT
jgi:hypothetical protein